MIAEFAPGVPHVRQTLRLPVATLESMREWAVEGSGLTAAVRVRDPAGRVALVKNGWSDGWILPGGGVEPGEEPADAARRELREETGLCGEIGAPLVVLDQTYVSEGAEAEGEEWFTAAYVVYTARAAGEIADPSTLGVAGEEITAARWFETLPDELHDGDLLRSYLREA